MASNRLSKIILSMLICLAGAAAGDSECSRFCGSSPEVKISDGCVCGTVMYGLEKGSFDAFLGVPFAMPPVGKLRFTNPVPNEPWKEFYNASTPKEMCIQNNDLIPTPSVEGAEDCLYLNVYRPQIIDDHLPVMVFIHGGGYSAGSAHPSLFGPEKFMDNHQKVILVTIQYRLGALGFLSTGDAAAPGNFGLKDQSMALRWVRKNIREFGGDHHRVTIFGQSSGASSVHLHLMSPLSKGLFDQAIMQSGSALASWNEVTEDSLSLTKRQAAVVGITNVESMSSHQLVEALREVDPEILIKSSTKLKTWGALPIVLYTPVVEWGKGNGCFLEEHPIVLWAEGGYQKVPLMAGFLPNEGAVVSLAILSNPSALQSLIEGAEKLIPLIATVPGPTLTQLNDRFFGGRLINKDSADGLSTMITEEAFLYPMMNGIKHHLKNGLQAEAPVTLYYFNFRGMYSYSSIYQTGQKDYGICHGEELMYLFRQRVLFPDFLPYSREAAMSRELVRQFVRFAYNGRLSSSPKSCGCRRERNRIGMVEFTNSDDPAESFKVNHVAASDAKMTALWDMCEVWENICTTVPIPILK